MLAMTSMVMATGIAVVDVIVLLVILFLVLGMLGVSLLANRHMRGN